MHFFGVRHAKFMNRGTPTWGLKICALTTPIESALINNKVCNIDKEVNNEDGFV